MAFIKSNGVVTSFARYQDVLDRDQRLFEVNEGLTEEVITPLLKRATERVLTKFRLSEWWKQHFTSTTDIPALDANKVIARQNDFTDLCVATALSEYILPKVADFGNVDSAENQKIGFYTQRAETLFGELITDGDWYDFDGSGAITSSEKSPGYYNPKRVR